MTLGNMLLRWRKEAGKGLQRVEEGRSGRLKGVTFPEGGRANLLDADEQSGKRRTEKWPLYWQHGDYQ